MIYEKNATGIDISRAEEYIYTITLETTTITTLQPFISHWVIIKNELAIFTGYQKYIPNIVLFNNEHNIGINILLIRISQVDFNYSVKQVIVAMSRLQETIYI